MATSSTVFTLLMAAIVLVLISTVIQAEDDVPTLVQVDPFDPVKDAERLWNAMDGIGTDEAAIIDVLARRPMIQAENISATYKILYGRDLDGDLKGDLGGSIQNIMILKSYPVGDFLASQLNEAMAGIDADEDTLTEILISRNNEELAATRDAYLRRYGTTLAEDITDETSFSFQHLLLAMAEGSRDESLLLDSDLIFQDTTRLYLAAEARPENNEDEFVVVFSQRSYPHIMAITVDYKERYGSSLRAVIDAEFTEGFRSALLAILDYAESRSKYMALRLKSTMTIVGTNENGLTRLVVSRADINLETIKEEYQRTFGISLLDEVQDETSGTYEDALVAIINGNRQPPVA